VRRKLTRLCSAPPRPASLRVNGDFRRLVNPVSTALRTTLAAAAGPARTHTSAVVLEYASLARIACRVRSQQDVGACRQVRYHSRSVFSSLISSESCSHKRRGTCCLGQRSDPASDAAARCRRKRPAAPRLHPRTHGLRVNLVQVPFTPSNPGFRRNNRLPWPHLVADPHRAELAVRTSVANTTNRLSSRHRHPLMFACARCNSRSDAPVQLDRRGPRALLLVEQVVFV